MPVPYDVDFSDTGGSLLATAQYTVWSSTGLGTGTGTEIISWTNIATGINAASYTTNWSVAFASLTEGINYVSARAYDGGGNMSAVATDVFYVKKDIVAPAVVDLQTGDDTEYATNPGAIFDVDFSDNASGSLLATAQYSVWSAPSMSSGTGTEIITWTNIDAGINAASYTASWGVAFNTIQNGVNYISARVYDNAGNVSAVATDVFYVKKNATDTTPPTVVDLQTGDDTWYGTGVPVPYDVDFSDIGGSLLATAQYSVWSAPNMSSGTGTEIITWTNIASSINAASYTTDWSVNFASLTEGINYVSVRVYDNVGAIQELPIVATDVFYIKKDTVAPTFLYASPPQGGLTVMYESATSSVIDIDFGWLGVGSATGTGQSAPLQWADYKIGAATTTWLNVFNSPLSATYTTNWSVDFGAATEGYNEISLRVADAAGNTATDSYASNTAGFWYWKDTIPDLAIAKSATVTAPASYVALGDGVSGANHPVPGALIHYLITYSNSTATAVGARVRDGIPTNSTRVLGSIKLNGVFQTDAKDGDECDFNVTEANKIICFIPTLPQRRQRNIRT